MTGERRSYDADIAELKGDVRWIRQTLTEADLVNRVGHLERAQAKTSGILAAVIGGAALVGTLTAAAKTLGILP